MIRVIFAMVLPIALLFFSCSEQQLITKPLGFESSNVVHMHAEDTNAGMFYSLPRTIVVIDIEVMKTENMPGPYARYANRFLGLDDAFLSESHHYEIKSVKVSSYAEPDPDHLYFVSFPDDISHDVFFKLSKTGLIEGISKTRGFDDPKSPYEYSKDFGSYANEAVFNYFMDMNITERIDTLVEYVFEDTLAIQRQTFRRSLVEKSTEQRAREVAEYILQIRDKKFDLISGFQEIPYTKDALEFMFAELSKLENDYLALFTGITTHSAKRYRFLHRPSIKDVGKKHKLFVFSANEGVIAHSGIHGSMNEGRPFTISYKPGNATFSLEQKLQQRHNTVSSKASGIHYRIPEYADIDLLLDQEPKAKSRILINQFGVINALPLHKMEIEFHPATGSIRSVGLLKGEKKEEKL